MQNKKSAAKTNLIFTGVLLALAVVLFLVTKNREAGTKAVITYGTKEGSRTMELLLDQEQKLDVEAENLTVHIEVKDGKIRFFDSPCPDHICEREGWLQKDGDSASCLPAPASILVISQD